MHIKNIALVATLFALTACGQASSLDQECQSGACTEASINAPIYPGEEERSPASDLQERSPFVGDYRFPEFEDYWELPKEMYDKAVAYYYEHQNELGNLRYVTVIDMRQHSSKRRFYLFDLKFVKVERYLTTHGLNSDQDNDGFADSFSNVNGSKQSSLGFYLTAETYTGSNGHSMRLDGLSETNSNARERAIVMHPATYVNEAIPRAGRSWGCPALDPRIARNVIDRLKSGSLLLIDQ